MKNCLICDRISLIKASKNPYFVKELNTGYVVLGDHQFFRGYTLFLSKWHKKELHKLATKTRKEFLWEMSLVAEAVHAAFKPKKLNYELLGNTDSHLHWHIFPRYSDDPMPRRAVWCIDKKIRETRSAKPSSMKLRELVNLLSRELERVLNKRNSPSLS